MINKKNKADKLLQKLQKIAMSSLVAKQKVAEVSKTVAEVMSADVFVCCLLADNKYLECLSNFGLDEDIEDQWRADEDEIGKIALEKNSVVINNLDEVYDNFVFKRLQCQTGFEEHINSNVLL